MDTAKKKKKLTLNQRGLKLVVGSQRAEMNLRQDGGSGEPSAQTGRESEDSVDRAATIEGRLICCDKFFANRVAKGREKSRQMATKSEP